MNLEYQSEIIRRIRDLNAATEDCFCSIGLKIQEYSEKALAIADLATDASRTLSGNDLVSALEGLAMMVDQLEDILSRVDSLSDANMASLRSIGTLVTGVEKDLMNLGETSGDLKMLALSTKIQSTKTGSEEAAFMQLGQDIAKMAVIISSKAKDLLSDTAILSGFVKDVGCSLKEIKGRQKYQTEHVLGGTKNIVEEMSNLSAKSKQEAGRIQLGIDKISHSISEMVTSVQYQDISKQALEKVVGEMELPVEENRHVDESERGSTKPFSLVSEEIRQTGKCLYQINLMERADRLVKEAFGRIIISLETISTGISGMTTVTNTVNVENTRFLGNLETAMSSVTCFLKEVVQTNRDMSVSMNHLARTVEGMSMFTEDIEMISSDVELISLNAGILAAQAGIYGAGMGVIASAVKKTAGASDMQRSSVVSKLDEISEASEDLKVKMESVTSHDEQKLDQLVRELGVFLDTLRVMQGKVVTMLTNLDSTCGELVSAIASSIEELRSQTHFNNESEQLIRDMKSTALSCCVHIKPHDLLSIAGDGYQIAELREMETRERLELVRAFFEEHGPKSHLLENTNGMMDDLDILMFDKEV